MVVNFMVSPNNLKNQILQKTHNYIKEVERKHIYYYYYYYAI